jgi:hypothetical protein
MSTFAAGIVAADNVAVVVVVDIDSVDNVKMIGCM